MILFTMDNYEFRDDGFAVDILKTAFEKPQALPYCVESRDGNPGDDACVFWVWDDGTKSLAPDSVQDAYRNYVAGMIVT